jgi:hypothetical protein
MRWKRGILSKRAVIIGDPEVACGIADPTIRIWRSVELKRR